MTTITEQERLATTLTGGITDAVGQLLSSATNASNDTGYGVLFTSNIAVGETVHWNVNTAGVLTLDQRGLDGSTPQAWDATTTKFVTGVTLSFLNELRALALTSVQLDTENLFTVSPKVPLATTEDEEVMSRKEIFDNYATGIAGVSSVEGKTGALTFAEIVDAQSSKLIYGLQYFN
jgi:hypothetical protein